MPDKGLCIVTESGVIILKTSSRVRRHRLIPLTEPYIRASYTAHVHSYLA